MARREEGVVVMDLGFVDSRTRRKARQELGSRTQRRVNKKMLSRRNNDTTVLPKHELLELLKKSTSTKRKGS